MNYKFPVINHINDVLPHIKDCAEFVVAERDGFTVVNYNVQTYDTFPEVIDNDLGAAMRRECRGITFYRGGERDGEVAARKYHKFFNVNERDETQFHLIDITAPHVILHKLDGSMITPFVRDDEHVEWHTKMGATDVAGPADDFASRGIRRVQGKKVQAWYKDFAFDLAKSKLTPIFEWCSRQQQIVLDYPEDDLVLTAVRRNITGEYISYSHMNALANPYGVPVIEAYEATFNEEFLEHVRGLIDLEGFVIRYDDGHMLKIKAEEYLKFHRAINAISQEKNVWALIIDAEADDLKGFLPADDRVRVEAFETVLWNEIIKLTDSIEYDVKVARDELNTQDFSMFDQPEKEYKKRFAVNYALRSPVKGLLFAVFDGKDARTEVLSWIKGHLGSGTKLDGIRPIFNDIRFAETKIEE